jgi:FkbM family methyltransferase
MPGFYRYFITLFLASKSTYLLGMVFVRMARKARKRRFRENQGIENVTINNFAGNLQMRVDKNSYMGGSIYWTGYHHINEFLYLKKALSPDMTFVDVGANQGEFTLFASSLLKNGNVISFEPVSSNFNSLTHNVELNGLKNVQIQKMGLFDKEDQMPIYTSMEETLHSGRHEGLSTLFAGDTRSTFEETIELKVFDDLFFDSLTRFDFLKIDIEGAELYAMKGMIKALRKFKPGILIEMSHQTFLDAGYTVKEMLDFLFELGYEPYTLYRGNLVKKESVSYDDWGNYVFLNPFPNQDK